ncbi:MAG: hypothetical protein WCT14_12440 [Treponemataceae bacterium]
MATKQKAASADKKPTPAEIEKRAHEIYLDRVRKNESGTPETDWYRAEMELSGRSK